MGHHFIAIDRIVEAARREGVARTRGRERLEADMREEARGTDVPRIGNEECAVAIMQRAKDMSFLSLSSHLTSFRMWQNRCDPECTVNYFDAPPGPPGAGRDTSHRMRDYQRQ